MKDLFSEEEKRQIYFLSQKGKGEHNFLPGRDLDIQGYSHLVITVNTYQRFEKLGLLTLGKLEINPSGYNEDIFLLKYLELVSQKKYEDAKILATSFDLDILNQLNEGKILIKDIEALNDFEKYGQIWDSPLGMNISDILYLNIEIKEQLLELNSRQEDNEKISSPDDHEERMSQKAYFNEKESYLLINGKKCPIQKHSRQYEFLRIIFTNPDETWQFSDIGEKIDKFGDFQWKRLYNWCNSLGKNIGYHTQAKDFFITTTQSVAINPIYLKKQETIYDNF